MKVSERDEVFLAEMGIAPLWRLRADARAEAADAAAPGVAMPGAAAPGVETLAEPAPSPYGPDVIPPPPRDPAWGAVPLTAAPAPVPYVAPAPAAPPPGEDAGPGLDEIAAMDWDELRTAIANCRRCGACEGRKPVHGAGARSARWFVTAGASSAADEQAGQPLAGDAGKLFDNMLAAVGMARARDVYVTNLVKCRPLTANGGERAPSADEVAACRPFVERELALSGAGTVLSLGQIAANGLLGKPLQEPLAGSRGAVHAFGAAALVATLHPGELLRRGADKALAWADLCRARSAHGKRAR